MFLWHNVSKYDPKILPNSAILYKLRHVLPFSTTVVNELHCEITANSIIFSLLLSLKERLRTKDVGARELMAYFKQPVATSRNYIRAADYMGTTLQLLAEKFKYVSNKPFNISGT